MLKNTKKLADIPSRITAGHEVIYPRYDPDKFVGREWLVKKAAQFRDRNDSRHLIIVGEPGSGKSTLLAYLAETWNCPRHFIRADNIGGVTGVDPRAFLLSIGTQLFQKYGADIFASGEAGSTRVRVGMSKDEAEVVGRVVDELVTPLPFLHQERDIEVTVGAALGNSQVIGERIRRLVNNAYSLPEKTLLHIAVLQPLEKLGELYPKEVVVILVDALDESLEHSGPSILDVIPKENDDGFPPNLRLVMTSRPGDHLTRFRAQDQLRLDDRETGYYQETIRDTRKYIQKRRKEEKLSEAMKGIPKRQVELFFAEVEKKSDGNFLYLYHYMNVITESIRAGETDLDEIPVPEDLDEIYRFFAVDRIRKITPDVICFSVEGQITDDIRKSFEQIENVDGVEASGENVILTAQDGNSVLGALFRIASETGLQFKDPVVKRGQDIGTWEEKVLPVLGILAVAFVGLRREQISFFTRVDVVYVDTIMKNLSQFVDQDKTAFGVEYGIYHRSFSEYLLDPARNQDFPLEGKLWHAQIVDCYRKGSSTWDEVDWSDVADIYPYRFLTKHIIQAERQDELHSLLNKNWIKAQRKNTRSNKAFFEDVELAISLELEARDLDYFHLLHYFYISATLGSITTSVPVEFIHVLSQLGQLSRAIEYVDLLPQPRFKSEGYLSISQELLEQGEEDKAKLYLEKAIAVLESIGEEFFSLVSIFKKIAFTASQLGDKVILFQLTDIASQFKDNGNRVRALCAISTALFRANFTTEAEQNVSRALKTARDANYGYFAGELLDLVQALVDVGFIQEAKAAAWERLARIQELWTEYDFEFGSLTENDVWLSQVYKSVTQSMGLLKDTEGIDAILELVQNIEFTSEKIVAINDVAQAMILANKEDTAKVCAIQAFEDCVAGLKEEGVFYYSSEIVSLTSVATNLKEIGMVSEAESLAKQAIEGIHQGVFSPEEIETTIQSASIALALLKDVQGVVQLLDNVHPISNDYDQVQALIWLTQAFHDLELEREATLTAHQALSIAVNIEDSTDQIVILRELSKVMVSIGLIEDAREAILKAYLTACSIPEEVEKNSWLSEVIRGLAELKLRDETKQAGDQIVRLSENAYEKVSSLSKVALAYSLIGLAKEAGEIAQLTLTSLEAMADGYLKKSTRIDVLDTLCHLGMREEAKDLIVPTLNYIQEFEDEWERATRIIALLDVVSKLEDIELLLSIKASAAPFDDQTIQAMVLSHAALVLFRCGRQEEAKRTGMQSVKTINNETQNWVMVYNQAMIDVISTFIQLDAEKETQQALSWFTEKIQRMDDDTYEKHDMFLRLSRILIEANLNIEAAEIARIGIETARNITRERKKVKQLGDWVSILAKLENKEEIRNILDTVEMAGEQSLNAQVYREIIQAYVDLGMRNEAKEVTELALQVTEKVIFIDDFSMARSFCSIAAALIAVDNHKYAAKIAAKAIHAMDAITYPNELATLIRKMIPILNALKDDDGLQKMYQITQHYLATDYDDEKIDKVRCLCEFTPVFIKLQKEEDASAAISLASGIANLLETNFSKATALGIVAKTLFQIRQIEQSQVIVQQTKHLVETITDDWEKGRALREFAPVWATVEGSGAIDGIEKLLKTIQSDVNKADAKSGYVQALAILKDDERLKKIHVDLVDDGCGSLSVDRMRMIALSFYDIGMVAEAKQVSRMMLKISLEFTNERHKANSLGDVIRVMAYMQDIESLTEIKSICEAFKDRREKVKASGFYAQAISTEIGHQEALPLFIEVFNESRLAGRFWFLDTFSMAAPTLAAMDGGETLFQISNTFQEVDSWW
jgi:tetratricopeptide (TPR) repeat protein